MCGNKHHNVRGVRICQITSYLILHVQCGLAHFYMEEVGDFFLDSVHEGVFAIMVKDADTSGYLFYCYSSSIKNYSSEVSLCRIIPKLNFV